MIEYFQQFGTPTSVKGDFERPLVFNGSNIFTEIQNDHPVILFGNLKSPETSEKVDHAVTCYEVIKNGWAIFATHEVYANFGWQSWSKSYTQVLVEGTWGGMLSLRGLKE